MTKGIIQGRQNALFNHQRIACLIKLSQAINQQRFELLQHRHARAQGNIQLIQAFRKRSANTRWAQRHVFVVYFCRVQSFKTQGQRGDGLRMVALDVRNHAADDNQLLQVIIANQ